MLTIISASSPKYTSADGSGIDLIVQFKEFPEPIPFHATPTDSMEYGVELFNRAKAGEFGGIQAYVPPPQPTSTGLKKA